MEIKDKGRQERKDSREREKAKKGRKKDERGLHTHT